MRNLMILAAAASLTACGGASINSAQSAGSVAVTTGGTTTVGNGTFVSPSEAKTYDGLGTAQHYEYYTDSNRLGQGGQTYAGDANTARDSGISVTYDPRDAIFDVTINRPKAIVNFNFRYQDPFHRTAFGGPKEPQGGVPNFDASRNIQYLEGGTLSGEYLSPTSQYYTPRAAASDYALLAEGSTSTRETFFYQKPGTTTKYVTYAGFVRNTISAAVVTSADPPQGSYLRETYSLDRAVFAYGERTLTSAVPKTGSGTYSGEMIASMVANVDPTSRADATDPTYIQWVQGNHTTTIDFAALTVKSTFTGTLLAAAIDAYTSGRYALPAGTAFSASATGTIDLVNRGGFTGSFGSACFAASCTPANSVVIAGSSLDGAFFGPNGEEIGGGFRIVGGTPDQRIDILGTFTGKK